MGVPSGSGPLPPELPPLLGLLGWRGLGRVHGERDGAHQRLHVAHPDLLGLVQIARLAREEGVDRYAVPLAGVPLRLGHRDAVEDLLAAGAAEADALVLARSEILPSLGTLELELQLGAVLDRGALDL